MGHWSFPPLLEINGPMPLPNARLTTNHERYMFDDNTFKPHDITT